MSIKYDTYIVVHYKIESNNNEKISTPIAMHAYTNEAAYLHKEYMPYPTTENSSFIHNDKISTEHKNSIKSFLNKESYVYELYKSINSDDSLQHTFSTVYNEYISEYKKYLTQIGNPVIKQNLIDKEYKLKQSKDKGSSSLSVGKILDYTKAWQSYFNPSKTANKSKNADSFLFVIENLYEYSNTTGKFDPYLFIANLICGIKFISWLNSNGGDNVRSDYLTHINNDPNIEIATLGNDTTSTFGVRDVDIAKNIIRTYTNPSGQRGGRTPHFTRRTNYRALRRTMKNAFTV